VAGEVTEAGAGSSDKPMQRGQAAPLALWCCSSSTAGPLVLLPNVMIVALIPL
jgi:hypothetical protein